MTGGWVAKRSSRLVYKISITFEKFSSERIMPDKKCLKFRVNSKISRVQKVLSVCLTTQKISNAKKQLEILKNFKVQKNLTKLY